MLSKSNAMIKRLTNFKKEHPFTTLLLIAIILRLIVVIVFPGYGSHAEMQRPSLVLALLKKVTCWSMSVIGSEKASMVLSRSFYAIISLLTVAMSYRIADLLTNKKDAWLIALIPVFSIIMPSFGIVNSINAFIGAPFLLYGCMVILRQEVLRRNNLSQNVHRTSFFMAGFSLGLASCIWIPCFLVVISLLLILFARKNPKGTVSTFIGVFSSIAIIAIIMLLCNINPWPYLCI